MGVGGLVTEKIRVPLVSALARERLDVLLGVARQRRLSVVVAPAGAGKTTLLARFCVTAGTPVAWYQADSSDAAEERVVAYLDAAFGAALPSFGTHTDIDDLVADLGNCREAIALVVDDAHTLNGSPAEGILERLVSYFPRHGVVVAAGREYPGFDVSRHRLAGDLLEIGGDDLRFRTWEVERLFRDFYGVPLPPTELAELARRTAGWAAGLQLFHLATHDKSPHVRRATLEALATRSNLVREYLTRHVLADLPDELRSFLLATCVLTDVTPELCDRLLGTTGSNTLLAELHRRQIFTVPLDDCGTYRYHEVLRSHLLGELLEEVGEAGLRRRFSASAEVLEAEGRTADAAAAFARAGATEALGRLLGSAGAALASDPGDWVAALPPAVTEHDPWVMLGAARWHLQAGRWESALVEYRRAEQQFGAGAAAEMCRRERAGLQWFLEPEPVLPAAGPGRWAIVLRRALQRVPSGVADPVDGSPVARLAAGIAALVAGYPDRARALLETTAFDPRTSPLVAAASRLAGAAAHHWAPGTPPAGDAIVPIAKEAETVGGRWLGGIGTACLALTGRRSAIDAVEQELLTEGPPGATGTRDPWTTMIAHWTCGVGELAWDPDGSFGHFRSVADSAGQVGAPVLEAWARSGMAYAAARLRMPNAHELATHAEHASRVVGVPGARAVAFAALAATSDSPGEHALALKSLVDECGLQVAAPTPRAPNAGSAAGAEGSTELRCFGGLRVRLSGRPVTLDGLKPRWRSLLALLALHADRPVHRDVLAEALWPGADPTAAVRSLQVAVSGLRGHLQRDNGERPALVARIGDAYVLRLPVGSVCDHEQVRAGRDRGRQARARGAPAEAAAALDGSLEAYGGDLLPEEGAADWVVEARDQLRQMAADTARELAEVLAETGDLGAAGRAAARGLEIDRYRDDLWHLRIELLQRGGETATLERTRAAYEEVLAELGVAGSTPL